MDGTQNIASIFESFYKITRARLSLHDTEFNELLSFPKSNLPFCNDIQKNRSARKKCLECDKIAFETVQRTGKTYCYTCHCGLTETVAPIYHFGVLSGYIMMGQIAGKELRSKQNIRAAAKEYFENAEQLSAAILQIPEIPADLISAYTNILTVISEFLTKSNFLSTHTEDRPRNIRNYINAHFTENISINTIAAELDCSRATVMNCFKKAYGTTINTYLNERRLEHAAQLLQVSGDSVKSISATCGFNDQNYFSRVFFQKFGTTPTDYRTHHKSVKQ